MKAVFKRGEAYVKTRDTRSWFFFIAGVVVIALFGEAIRIYQDTGPQGQHHGDVAGGFLLLEFFFRMVPFVLALAVVGTLLGKSTVPLVGAVAGLAASFPISFVLGIFRVLLLSLSPFLGVPFPFVVGIALVLTGILRKAKNENKASADALSA